MVLIDAFAAAPLSAAVGCPLLTGLPGPRLGGAPVIMLDTFFPAVIPWPPYDRDPLRFKVLGANWAASVYWMEESAPKRAMNPHHPAPAHGDPQVIICRVRRLVEFRGLPWPGAIRQISPQSAEARNRRGSLGATIGCNVQCGQCGFIDLRIDLNWSELGFSQAPFFNSLRLHGVPFGVHLMRHPGYQGRYSQGGSQPFHVRKMATFQHRSKSNYCGESRDLHFWSHQSSSPRSFQVLFLLWNSIHQSHKLVELLPERGRRDRFREQISCQLAPRHMSALPEPPLHPLP